MAFHGISIIQMDGGSRTINVPSASIIGLVGTYDPTGTDKAPPNKPILITRLTEGVKAFGANDGTDKYTIPQALEAIYDQCNAVVVVVGVPVGASPAETLANIIGKTDETGQRKGLEALLDSQSANGQKARLLCVPKYSATQSVAAKMEVIAEKSRAIAYISGPNTTDDAAKQYADKFGGKRLYMIDPSVQYFDTSAKSIKTACPTAYAVGLTAANDALNGYWTSPSNKSIKNILGTTRGIDYEHNDNSCRANILNNNKIATIINKEGYLLWGNRTLSSDSKWKFITTVRIYDMVCDAILDGHMWAVDRGLNKTYVREVEEGLRKFMSGEKRKGAVINFDAWVDKERTTESEIADGKCYWQIKFSDVRPAENPTFIIQVTNEYLSEILS